MSTKVITTKPSEIKGDKEIYIDGEFIGRVMADDAMTPLECYQSLKNNWEIDRIEKAHYEALDNALDY
jgi:hypothetical protein